MKKLLLFIALGSLINSFSFCMNRPANIKAIKTQYRFNTLKSFDESCDGIESCMRGCASCINDNPPFNDARFFEDRFKVLQYTIRGLHFSHLRNQKISRLVIPSPRLNSLMLSLQQITVELKELKTEKPSRNKMVLENTIAGLLQSLQEAKEKNSPLKSKL